MRTDRLVAAGAGGLAILGLYKFLTHRPRYDLRDKTVLITGGSRGLGLIMARKFAARGARIAICARDEAQVARARDELIDRGAEVFADTCDVRERQQVRRFISNTADRLGPVDVLVNCAGVIQSGPLELQTEDDFRDLMDVHFWGPYFAMQEVIPAMRQRGGGRIVNITSIGAKIAVPHLASYCASKFALAGLSKAFAAELAKDDIIVTTVYPGLMRTGSHINARFKGQNEKEFALFSLMDATPLTAINAGRAAEQIIDACESGRAELVISMQAKFAATASALAPEFTARMLALSDSLLPGPGGIGIASVPGSASTSPLSPSPITALIDKAAIENNEV